MNSIGQREDGKVSVKSFGKVREIKALMGTIHVGARDSIIAALRVTISANKLCTPVLSKAEIAIDATRRAIDVHRIREIAEEVFAFGGE